MSQLLLVKLFIKYAKAAKNKNKNKKNEKEKETPKLSQKPFNS